MSERKTIRMSDPLKRATITAQEREFTNRLSRVCDRYLKIVNTNSPLVLFKEQEFLFLCEEYNGQEWQPASSIRQLKAYVEDENHMRTINNHWGIDVMSVNERLQKLTLVQTIVLIEAIELFWSRHKIKAENWSEMLSKMGLKFIDSKDLS